MRTYPQKGTYTNIRTFTNSYAIDYYIGAHTVPQSNPPFLHTHSYNELLLVRKGVFLNYIGTTPTQQEGPHIIFNRAGQPHITTGPQDTVYERYNIYNFHRILKNHSISLASMDSFVCPLEDKDALLFHYAELLLQESVSMPSGRDAEPYQNLLLLTLLEKTFTIAQRYIDGSSEQNLLYIRHVLKYIHGNYTHTLTIDDLLREFFVGRSKFCRDFRQYTGMTVNRYITGLRIDRAKELLRSGSSVRETAALVGFEYESNFISVFHRQTGVTPLQFKRNANM